MRKPKKIRKLIKSAKMGNPCAMYRLGICYQLGKYVEQDMNIAAMWIEQSAIMGNKYAVDWIKDYSFDDNAGIQSLD